MKNEIKKTSQELEVERQNRETQKWEKRRARWAEFKKNNSEKK